jgi:hypothetical protein
MLPFTEHLYIRLHYSPKEQAVVQLDPGSTELAVAGGLFVELLLDGRIRLTDSQIIITDPRPTQDELLDEALARLAAVPTYDQENPEWFAVVANHLPFGSRLIDRLLQKGILHQVEKRGFMGLSKTVLYPFREPALAQMLFETERAVMIHGSKPDPRTAALIFMAYTWPCERPWELSRQESKAYDNRGEALFGDYWGYYGTGKSAEPIGGLAPDIREAIGNVTVSWATIQAA